MYSYAELVGGVKGKYQQWCRGEPVSWGRGSGVLSWVELGSNVIDIKWGSLSMNPVV